MTCALSSVEANNIWTADLCQKAQYTDMILNLVAIIGKRDEPLYFFSEESEEEALNLKQMAHGALDLVDERVQAAKEANRGDFDSYLGKLMSAGDHEVFGYLSSTKIKIIVVCGVGYQSLTADGSPRNISQVMRNFLTAIYGIYSKEVRNPLQSLNSLCRSDNFNSKIAAASQAFTSNLSSMAS